MEGDRDICHQYSVMPCNIDFTMPPGIYGFKDTSKVHSKFLEVSFGSFEPCRADLEYLVWRLQDVHGLHTLNLQICSGKFGLNLYSLTQVQHLSLELAISISLKGLPPNLKSLRFVVHGGASDQLR